MGSVKDRIFVGGQHPSSDINPWLDDLAGSIFEEVDGMAPEVYDSMTGAKTPYKPFIVGFIPPDVVVNHVPIERDQSRLGTINGEPTKGHSTAAGQSASGGAGSPRELVKTETIFTQKALGNSIYNNLKKRHFSEADARRLTPLLVGHARAELAAGPKGSFKTDCFNIGNVHSSGPKQGGYYYKGKDFHGSGEKGLDPKKVGQPYDTYFVGAPTLDEGVDRWVGATLGWKQTRNATNGQEFAKALRPDIFPESRGGNNGPYFTAGSSAEDPLVLGYGRNVQGGANMYSAQNKDPSIPDPNGILAGGPNEPSASDGDLNKIDIKEVPNRADIMTGGEITTLEEDDPIGGRTGRNISLAKGKRLEVVNRQVEDLRRQVDAVRATPALYMLVSPQSFNRSYEHTVDAPKGRRKHIVHMWLEKPMTISCKGVTAAQYIFDGSGQGGLTNKNRVHSLSYRNLMSLVRMYKNNGFLFSQDSSGEGNSGVRMIGMSVFIYFDGHVYIGSFDDFSVTDTSEKPYNLEYSFKFTCRYDMEASTVTDAEVGRSIGGR